MRSPKSIVLAIIFFVGILWFRSADRQHKSDASVDMAIAIVESVPEYGQNQVFFDTRLAGFHERAFGLAYKKGRFKSSFGENIYRTVLLRQFLDDAEAAGNTEVFDAMRRELGEAQQ